jgi:hypothetical protein
MRCQGGEPPIVAGPTGPRDWPFAEAPRVGDEACVLGGGGRRRQDLPRPLRALREPASLSAVQTVRQSRRGPVPAPSGPPPTLRSHTDVRAGDRRSGEDLRRQATAPTHQRARRRTRRAGTTAEHTAHRARPNSRSNRSPCVLGGSSRSTGLGPVALSGWLMTYFVITLPTNARTLTGVGGVRCTCHCSTDTSKS